MTDTILVLGLEGEKIKSGAKSRLVKGNTFTSRGQGAGSHIPLFVLEQELNRYSVDTSLRKVFVEEVRYMSTLRTMNMRYLAAALIWLHRGTRRLTLDDLTPQLFGYTTGEPTEYGRVTRDILTLCTERSEMALTIPDYEELFTYIYSVLLHRSESLPAEGFDAVILPSPEGTGSPE